MEKNGLSAKTVLTPTMLHRVSLLQPVNMGTVINTVFTCVAKQALGHSSPHFFLADLSKVSQTKTA